MLNQKPVLEVYQLRISVRQISPMIWRRLLVRSDTTIAKLHYTLQIVMDWSNAYLHQFLIRGKRYGIARMGGLPFMDDAYQIRLSRFALRPNEKFLYEYNFYDNWQLEIRFETRLSLEPEQRYPFCIGGKRAAPPEDCGGPYRFMQLKDHYSVWEIGERLLAILTNEDFAQGYEDYSSELRSYLYWLDSERFDRQGVNQRLDERISGQEERSP